MRTRSRPALFVTDRGAGEPVLLITGWTISSAVFDPVADLYVPHVRVVAYDHRGAGRSAPWLAPVSMAMLAADAARVLDDRGIAQRARGRAVDGRGGRARAGDPDAAPRQEPRPRRRRRRRPDDRAARHCARGGRHASARCSRTALRHRHAWPAAALFSAALSRTSTRTRSPSTCPSSPATAHRRGRPGGRRVAAACFGRRGSLRRVRAPTLVLHGGRDAMVPVANADLLADGIPGAELHVVHDAGHAVPLEHPTATAELLIGWMRRHATSSRPPPRRVDVIGERIARPFSLHAGTLRNTRDATAPMVRRIRGMIGR